MADRFIVPARAPHLLAIDIQSGQSSYKNMVEENPVFATYLVENSIACFSLMVDGVPVGILGVLKDPMDEGRGTAWALFAKDAGKHLRFVLKKSVEVLDNLNMRRIETTASHGSPQEKRWLELLGFDYEGTMRAYDIMGYDHDIYARVKNRGN